MRVGLPVPGGEITNAGGKRRQWASCSVRSKYLHVSQRGFAVAAGTAYARAATSGVHTHNEVRFRRDRSSSAARRSSNARLGRAW